MLSSKKSKGCWTCKQRRIACDRKAPSCHTCRNSGRICLGYGTRLSWPRPNDQKRAIFLDTPFQQGRIRSTSEFDFINVFSYDIELFGSMSNSLALNNRPSSLPRLSMPLRWMIYGTDIELFSYYQHNVIRLLTGANNSQIQNLVFRMSFTDASPSSSAILLTIYALSCLHLEDRSRASVYKSNAVKAVNASASQHSGKKDILQCIIAANLLAMFETLANPTVENGWAMSICFSKSHTIASYALDKSYEGDLALVLDWVYYYDVLSKFSVRHFSKRGPSMLTCAREKHLMLAQMNAQDRTNILPTFGCSLEVLSAISSLLDTLLDIDVNGGAHTDALDKLERRFKFANQTIKVEALDDPYFQGDAQQIRHIAELYRLAGLIYLQRAGRKALISGQVLQGLVNDAYKILGTMETCERTWPLFIIGCEARSDDRRATILRIISETYLKFTCTNMIRSRAFIERFWAQDDLDTGQRIEYDHKITAALSIGDSLPAFA